MDIITRDAAREQGLKRFFTGKPCKRGHVVERQTSNGTCMECAQLKQAASYWADPAKARANRAAYKEANREQINAKARKKYAESPELRERIKQQGMEWRAANKEAIAQRDRTYRQENWSKLLATKAAYERQRRESDPDYMESRRETLNRSRARRWSAVPQFRISCILRARLKDALGGKQKAATTQELVGIDWAGLVAHIEKQFLPGMSWENYGYETWHIDHIKPCASFDLTDPAQQRECFHYSNLQPLWAKDNLSKSARLDWERVA